MSSLFDSLFPKKYTEDDFGYSSEWNNEIQKWLECIYGIDEKYFDRQRKRVIKARDRDALLGEYKAIYIFQNKLGYQVTSLEKQSTGGQVVDFEYVDPKTGLNWKAEVKSPSWRAEIAHDYKRGELSKSQLKERLSEPHYKNGEARSIGVADLKESIYNSLGKFKSGENNILVLCPDMFGSFAFFGKLEEWHRLRKLIEEVDVSKLIKQVCMIEVDLTDKGFIYHHEMVAINQK